MFGTMDGWVEGDFCVGGVCSNFVQWDCGTTVTRREELVFVDRHIKISYSSKRRQKILYEMRNL